MKNQYQNKLLPLTIKQLKQAEQQYKSRKQKVYDSTTFEVIQTVARVVRLYGMDLKISDQSDALDIVIYADSLKKSTELTVGDYFIFSFIGKNYILKGGNSDGFGFEMIGIKKVEPNQITIHMANCLTQKITRQQFKQKQKSNQKKQLETVMERQDIIKVGSKKIFNQNITTTYSAEDSRVKRAQQDIKKYCKQLGEQFDIEKILKYFGGKYEFQEIEKVLQILSDKGSIMDLGLVYEWVEEQE